MDKEHSVDSYLRLAAKVFENSHEGIVVTNFKGQIELVNPSFTKITGYTLEEIIGSNPRVYKSGLHDDTFYYNLWNDLRTNGQWSGEVWNKKKDGSLYCQWMTLSSLRDEDGEVTGYASIFTDITEKKLVEEKLHEDLALAKRVQKSVLSPPIDNDEIKINGINIASEDLAGDMYAWYQISDHQYGIILIDVMGHGVASSLVCMSVRSLLRRLITKLVDPIRVTEELNEHMKSLFSGHKGRLPYYFSMIYLVIDTEKREINFLNAGHPPGILVSGDKLESLEAITTPIGFLPFIEAESTVVHYSECTQILLYSDGLLEIENLNISENINKLKDKVFDNQHLNNEQLINTILDKYVTNTSLPDDVTIVSIKLK